MLTCAQEKEEIKKVRDVRSNALDASEIRRRQSGATMERPTVKHKWCASANSESSLYEQLQ
jgi:hypothetical protein